MFQDTFPIFFVWKILIITDLSIFFCDDLFKKYVLELLDKKKNDFLIFLNNERLTYKFYSFKTMFIYISRKLFNFFK